jgi:hypothetical protein
MVQYDTSGTPEFMGKTTSTTMQVFQFALAYQWKAKKNNFHEIELTNLQLVNLGSETTNQNDTVNNNPIVGGGSRTHIALGMRYEYIYHLFTATEKKFVPSIGFGVGPYFDYAMSRYKVSNSFSNSQMQMGIRAFITPRFTYFFTPKFFLDVNVPLCLFDAYYESNTENNPATSAQEQRTNTLNYNQFPAFFSGRIGIGIKL